MNVTKEIENMDNERKVVLFDALVKHILEDADYNALSEHEVKSMFINMGFTKDEYQNNIKPIFVFTEYF